MEWERTDKGTFVRNWDGIYVNRMGLGAGQELIYRIDREGKELKRNWEQAYGSNF